MKTAFLKAWAEENKSKGWAPLSAYLIWVFIWFTCVLTFVQGVNPTLLPTWVQNLSSGTLFLLSTLMIGLGLIWTCVVGCSHKILEDLSLKVNQRDTSAREAYNQHKTHFAGSYLWKFKTIRFCQTILQVFLLYAGEAYFTGSIVFFSGLLFLLLNFIHKNNIANALDNFLTPESLQWLEAPIEVQFEEGQQKLISNRLGTFSKK